MSFNKNQDSYRRLREIVSERTRRLIIWCGAGLSVPAGLPDWSGLRGALSTEMKRKAETFDPKDRIKVEELAGRIALEKNPWVAFLRLRNELGQTSFEQAIRETLRTAATCEIPSGYSFAWRLRPAGILTLNLDRLVTRAFYAAGGARALSEFDSTNVGAHTHVLNGLSPFVYNLHGTHENANSWVITHDDLDGLFKNKAYQNFVKSAVSSATNLFLGLSADDAAVGGHLERLAQDHIKTGPHFWISPRNDRQTDQWAESAGALVIRYFNKDGAHGELSEMFEDLTTHVPAEETAPAPPVVASVREPDDELPTPYELARHDAETIRRTLNAKAAKILEEETSDSFGKFESFVNAYDEAIHRAWYVSTTEGRNILLGYQIESEVARGAFGRVFQARGGDGSIVAIKVLHNELRENRDLLLAFRRGVRSMSILKGHGVSGVVTYRNASEIPAFVVMDFVEGANLRDAVQAGRLDTWQSQLTVASRLSHIIAVAHGVPERVLHRDIRPANVMLEGFWTETDWRIVVLDFDLSWHRGAFDRSVVHGSGAAGYLAPEQIVKLSDASARHATVDSFGLGMTLYFALCGIDPLPAQHRHTDWVKSVEQAVSGLPTPSWLSLPQRYARLIVGSTQDRQGGPLGRYSDLLGSRSP